LSHQGEKKQKKKTEQSVSSSNAIQFQLVFQHAGIVWLLSNQRKKKEKKKSLETAL
jgi:hypothetical protein